jgi:predicted Zn finger-like uncharacterized protein
MPEQVRCPSCNAALRVPENLLGKNVKCPKCQTTFLAEMEEPAQPEGIVRERTPAANRSRVPDEADDEERPPEEEVEDRPRRRGRRRGRRVSAEAASAVAGPAIALMVVSGLAVALCIMSLLLNTLGAGLIAANPAQRASGLQRPDLAINAVAGVGSALFGLCYWIVVTVGAVKMKNLSSYGFAMTACILAMLPCSVCCILGLPFGIWGLVALNNPAVKDAFS